MDPVTQGAFGAGWAQSAASKDRILPATIVGCVSGMAPDLDVLISSSADPLLFLEYHRHFTHSLAFIPIGALICAAVLFRWVPGRMSFGETYVFAFLGFASHGLLDACTTYGTSLLWPFSDARIAWNNVSVIDPLFTVPVAILIIIAWRRGSPRYAHAAIAWAIVYLAFGLLQTHRAVDVATELAESRGHQPSRVQAMPAIASLLLWKSVYEHDGSYYVDAVRTGFGTIVFEGDSRPKLDVETHLPWLDPQSQQALDIERFRQFTGNFLGLDDETPNSIVDMRYSMLPQEADSLWGIVLDESASATEHVRFYTDRSVAPGRAGRLLAMLIGNCDEPDCRRLERDRPVR